MSAIIAKTKDAVLLIRKTASGARMVECWPDGFTADTWHGSVEDAMLDAENWWHEQLPVWRTVPHNIPDPVEYARTVFLYGEDQGGNRLEGSGQNQN